MKYFKQIIPTIELEKDAIAMASVKNLAKSVVGVAKDKDLRQLAGTRVKQMAKEVPGKAKTLGSQAATVAKDKDLRELAVARGKQIGKEQAARAGSHIKRNRGSYGIGAGAVGGSAFN